MFFQKFYNAQLNTAQIYLILVLILSYQVKKKALTDNNGAAVSKRQNWSL